MKYPHIVVIILFLANIGQTIGQVFPQDRNKNIYFENLNISEGLSQSTVSSIMQDRKGFMWFGTKDGLNRYDGLSFRIFKNHPEDRSSLGNNFTTELYEAEDGNIWVGTDAGLYIYDPQRESFERFSTTSNLKGTKIDRAVSKIGKGLNDDIWVAVESQGLFCYNTKEKTLENYILSDRKQISSNIECFAYDNSETFWIGSFGDGLFYSKDVLKTIHPFVPSDGRMSFEKDIITKLVQGPQNCLYVASVKNGLVEIDLSSGKAKTLLLKNENNDPIYIRDFFLNSSDEIWLGTESGIIIYNIKSGAYTHHKNSIYDPYSISDNAIYSLLKDREGGIWIGSYFGGINYYPKQYTSFDKYYPKNENNSLRSKRVREFCEGHDGNIWIGTEDGGLHNFNPITKKFHYLEASKNFTNIHGLCMDGDNLWIGTFMHGLKVLNTKTGAIKSYNKGDSPNSLNDNNIFSIQKTRDNQMYLGTLFGLHKYNRETDDFTLIPETKGKFIFDIKEDSFGDIWIATYANGAYRYDSKLKKWINYLTIEGDERSLSYNKVVGIFEDSKNQIWLTTQGGGFCKFDRRTQTFKRYNSKNGLPNNVVYQIVEDNNHYLWLTTNKGLVKFDPESEEIKVFTTANGLLENQFNYQSSFKDKKGQIYFGSIDGFISFDPSTFSENKNIPSVTITDFLLYNKNVSVGGAESPLTKSITFSDSIKLSYSQNSFSLRIAALSFLAPEMNQMMYKLDGFDNDWYYVGESPIVTYSNLKHGSYVFRAKASNSDGVWSDKETILYIEIEPPFYLTVWAYCFYLLLIAGAISYAFWYIKQRNARIQRRQMEIFEQEKEREVYNAKIDFFTNVAHEIRTPLTLIKGPLDNVILKKETSPDVTEDLTIMSRNTDRLLTLTNQLLDFRKTETQGFRLNYRECNISSILKEIHHRFTSLIKQKELTFSLNLPDEDVFADVDKEALTKIISNLFTNAIKYSSTYIRASLEVNNVKEEAQMFSIRVANDGVIVPKEFRESIFQPFMQYNPDDKKVLTTGTGIGLALARSLAELHQGSLDMDEVFDCNSFCLTMPVVQDVVMNLPSEANLMKAPLVEMVSEAKKDGESKPTVLIVEDNIEMLAFIKKQLRDDYTVLTADNGVNAIKILDETYVNLIISDVVMPEMSGFELCKKIKSDINYSHIPVILLTAKTNLQSKIEGLELGADAYIEKPFSVQYLQANVSNLIQNREKLRQAFANGEFVKTNTITLTKVDEDFLKRLDNIVQTNYENPEFSMDEIAEKMNMSRSSFYRKVKGVIDLSPNDYLRMERLRKATQLLKDGNYQVNEVCYLVGFSSPSYFSKCFQKQFGMPPKDYLK